jgi:hypothetical protein
MSFEICTFLKKFINEKSKCRPGILILCKSVAELPICILNLTDVLMAFKENSFNV